MGSAWSTLSPREQELSELHVLQLGHIGVGKELGSEAELSSAIRVSWRAPCESRGVGEGGKACLGFCKIQAELDHAPFSVREILECGHKPPSASKGWGQLLLLISPRLLGQGGVTSLEVLQSQHVVPEGRSTEQRLPGTVGMEESEPPGTHLEPPWVSRDHL